MNIVTSCSSSTFSSHSNTLETINQFLITRTVPVKFQMKGNSATQVLVAFQIIPVTGTLLNLALRFLLIKPAYFVTG